MAADGAWDGAPVRIQDCNGKRKQKWIIGGTGTGMEVRLSGTSEYEESGADKDFCLDNTDGDTEKPVQVWTCHSEGHADYANQRWLVRDW
jgi:hypothetical protein